MEGEVRTSGREIRLQPGRSQPCAPFAGQPSVPPDDTTHEPERLPVVAAAAPAGKKKIKTTSLITIKPQLLHVSLVGFLAAHRQKSAAAATAFSLAVLWQQRIAAAQKQEAASAATTQVVKAKVAQEGAGRRRKNARPERIVGSPIKPNSARAQQQAAWAPSGVFHPLR
jgi:hypothetical protein